MVMVSQNGSTPSGWRPSVGPRRPHAHPSPAAYAHCQHAQLLVASRSATAGFPLSLAVQGRTESSEPAERLAALRLVVQLRAGTPHRGRAEDPSCSGSDGLEIGFRSCVRDLRPPFMGLPEIVELKHRSSPGHEMWTSCSGCRGLSPPPIRASASGLPARGLDPRVLPASDPDKLCPRRGKPARGGPLSAA